MKWSFQENPPIVERDPLIKAVESPVTAVAHRASRCLQHHHTPALHCKVSLSPAEHQHCK